MRSLLLLLNWSLDRSSLWSIDRLNVLLVDVLTSPDRIAMRYLSVKFVAYLYCFVVIHTNSINNFRILFWLKKDSQGLCIFFKNHFFYIILLLYTLHYIPCFYKSPSYVCR